MIGAEPAYLSTYCLVPKTMEYRTAPRDNEYTLTDAVRGNDLERRFSELPIDDDLRSREEREVQLHHAVCENDVETIKTLLKLPPDLTREFVNNVNVACGCPLLFVACKKNTKEAGETVELLLALGADPNMVDEVKNSPLFGAIYQKSLVACRILLRYGANANHKDNSGNTPLKLAQLLNNSGACFMECLLEHGAEPCEVRYSNSTGNTMLHHAVIGSVGHMYTASPNVVNNRNICVISPKVAEVRLLVGFCLQKLSRDKIRAFVDATNEHGATALHLAARANDEKVVMLLLSAGADIEAQTNSNMTPLHEACHEGSLQIVQLLLKAGADTEARDHSLSTPIRFAERKHRSDVIRVMLDAGAVPSSKKMREYAAITAETAKLLEDDRFSNI